jgi:hypothetical protein
MKICEIITNDNQQESIVLNNLKILTNVEPFSLNFVHGENNISINPRGIFLSYMYYEKNVLINTFHNKLSFIRNDKTYIFDALKYNNSVQLHCRVKSQNKNITMSYVKNNNNIISYDINSPYEYQKIGNDMLYYRVKIFDDFDIVYNFYSFKVLYYVKDYGIYEILYKNKKIIINLLNDEIKDYTLNHKTLYYNKDNNNEYFKRMWITKNDRCHIYQIIKCDNKYDLTIEYCNIQNKFELYETNGKIYLSYNNFICHNYENLETFLKILKRNFSYFLAKDNFKHLQLVNKEKLK